MDSSTWDAAALVMGNSVRQWQASYNTTFRNRAVEGAVATHPTFISNMARQVRQLGGGQRYDVEDEEMEEGGTEADGGGSERHQPVGPIIINCEPGRRKKKQRVDSNQPPKSKSKRNGGSHLDPKGSSMLWGSIPGGW
jgi:hypothetical protein